MKIQYIFNLWKSWLPTLWNSLATFFSKTVAALSSKPFFSDRHYRILNWSKVTHAHVCTEDEVKIFIGTGGLLGIFVAICRQRPIIHWWEWRSGAPAA